MRTTYGTKEAHATQPSGVHIIRFPNQIFSIKKSYNIAKKIKQMLATTTNHMLASTPKPHY
jgi:hypothetical protein